MAQSSIQKFQSTVKPFLDHKNAYKKYKGETTEGGVPQTEAKEKIMKGREFQKKLTDVPMAALGTAWNIPFGKTGWRYGKDNWILQSKADVAQRKAELQESRLYREKRDRVRDQALLIADTAKRRFTETGDQSKLDLAVQGINEIMANEGLNPKTDFTVVSPEVLDMRDNIGLFTNNPNPYPAIEMTGYIGGGIYGSVKGEKLVRDKFFKGAAKGFGKSKGNWLARTAGAVIGGAMAVGVADYGYEGMLDMMNKAGKAKGYMRDPNKQASLVDATLATLVPESWTFGPQGINRPTQKKRLGNALNAAYWDAGLTAGFFALRPAYYGIRKVVGHTPFRMFRQKPSKAPGIVSGKELLEGEQRVLERWMPSQNELDLIATRGLKVPKEQLSFNLPLGLGNFLWRATNSKALNWLGPPGPIKKGSNEWWPDPTEIAGTMVGRQMVGGTLGGKITSMLSPAPLFGISIKNNMAKQSDFYIDGVMRKMIGGFAPYGHLDEMLESWDFLASQNLKGFIAQAKTLEKGFTEAAEGMGKGFSNENLVNVAKQTLREYREKLQLDPGGEIIPSEVRNKLIDFLEKQIIKPVGEGRAHAMLDVHQMKGLREQINDLLAPLKDKVLAKTTYADDISRLMKAWENDVASLEKMGYPDIAKAFDEYDKFVSSGLMLWGTNVGKTAARGEVKQRGFNIILDNSTTRASHTLFDTIINASKAHAIDGKAELAAIRRIVGDRGYHNGLGTYVDDLFNASIVEKEGLQYFDAAGFRAGLGLGKEGSKLKSLFSHALDESPEVTKLRIWEPGVGWTHFDDQVYETGVGKGLKEIFGEELPEGFIRGERTKMPTQKDFDDLSMVLSKLFENGVPSGAKFMMRRAVMGSTRSAVRAFIPGAALGPGAMGKGAAEAGTLIGIGPLMMSAAAFMINYGGKVLTNPVSHRVLKNMVDANLPETIRLANFARLVRMYPEEWIAFDRDLHELEEDQKMFDQSGQRFQQAQTFNEKAKDALLTTGARVGEAVMNPLDTLGAGYDAIKKGADIDPTPSLLSPKIGAPEGAVDYAPEAAGGAYDTSRVGASIMSNPTMNPAAAGALYTGNTDAALAAQYGGGTQYAAGGGLMEMNPVMNNQGKYTDIQTGINDNPFQNAQNKGIMGVL